METVCHNQLIFESLSSKDVIADFAGGRITSDAAACCCERLISATDSLKRPPDASVIPAWPIRLNMIS